MWEAIAANRRRSAVLICTMVVILIIIGYTGAELFAPGAGPVGLLIAVGIWGVMMATYLFGAETLLMQGANFNELSREDSPQLFNVVEEMKIASGLMFMPKLYLIHDDAPNAFAMGRSPGNYAICVTSGLLHRLNRDELQGVIAHEMGHLKNQDVKFMTLAAVLLGSIVILSDAVRRMLWYGGRGRRRDDSRGGSGQGQAIMMLVGLVFMILGPLMAQLLYFACSRKREYLADASAAQFTRYPEGLASALEKIALAGRNISFASRATAPMFIVNPLASVDDESTSLFATHPATADRIRILRHMAGAALGDYETAYRQMKQGSLIGSRSLATATPEPIRPPSNAGPLTSRQEAGDIAYRQQGYLPLNCTCGLTINVPANYERSDIRCVRCGSVLPIPKVIPVEGAAPAAPQKLVPLQYTRAGSGWESFRCACGHTIQLSPAFAAPHIRCNACGREIEIS